LLYQVPIGLALAHQAVAVLVLALGVVHLERLSPRSSATAAAFPRPVTAASGN
jgi:cytochrome c oxidase assembly protein subunit 15